MTRSSGESTALADLREAFDAAFAAPATAERPELERFVLARVGGEAVAFRVGELAGLVGGAPIVPVPSRNPAFLGVAGIRGAVVPVWSLAGLLGISPGREGWLALCAAPEPTALAVEACEGLVRVDPGGLYAGPGPAGREHVERAVPVGARVYPVVNVRSLIESIHRRIDSPPPRSTP